LSPQNSRPESLMFEFQAAALSPNRPPGRRSSFVCCTEIFWEESVLQTSNADQLGRSTTLCTISSDGIIDIAYSMYAYHVRHSLMSPSWNSHSKNFRCREPRRNSQFRLRTDLYSSPLGCGSQIPSSMENGSIPQRHRYQERVLSQVAC